MACSAYIETGGLRNCCRCTTWRMRNVSLSLSVCLSLCLSLLFRLDSRKIRRWRLRHLIGSNSSQKKKTPAPVGLYRHRYSPTKLNCLLSSPSALFIFLFVMLCLRLVILFSSSRHINKIFMAIC